MPAMNPTELDKLLYQECGGCCLDDDEDRDRVVRFILGLLSKANGTRDIHDDAHEVACIIRFHDPDDAFNNVDVRTIKGALCRAYPLLLSSEVEVLPLPQRPFLRRYA